MKENIVDLSLNVFKHLYIIKNGVEIVCPHCKEVIRITINLDLDLILDEHIHSDYAVNLCNLCNNFFHTSLITDEAIIKKLKSLNMDVRLSIRKKERGGRKKKGENNE